MSLNKKVMKLSSFKGDFIIRKGTDVPYTLSPISICIVCNLKILEGTKQKQSHTLLHHTPKEDYKLK